jgi:hypothetical protein
MIWPSLDRSGTLGFVFSVCSLVAVVASESGPTQVDGATARNPATDERAPAEVEVVHPAASLQTPVAFSRLFLDDRGQPLVGAHSDEGVFLYSSEDGWKPLTALIEPEAVWAGKAGILVVDAVGPGPAFEVKRFDRRGRLLSSFALDGRPRYVSGLAADRAGLIYINDSSHAEGIVSVYAPEGSLLRRFAPSLPAPGPAERALLNQAWIAVGTNHSVLVAFLFEPRFRVHGAEGQLLADVAVEHPLVDARRKEEGSEIPERFTLDERGRTVLRGFVYFTAASVLPDGRYALGFGDGSFVFFVSPRGELQQIWQLTAGGEPCRTFDYWDPNLAVAADRLRVGAGSVLHSRPGRILDFLLPRGAREVGQ